MEAYYHYGECTDYKKLFDFLYDTFEGDPIIYQIMQQDEIIVLETDYIDDLESVAHKLEEEFFCIELLEKPLTGFDQRLDRGDFDVFFNSDDL